MAYQIKRREASAPKMGGGSNPLETLMLAQSKMMMNQQEEKQKQEQAVQSMGEGTVPVSANIGGVTYQNPALSGQVKGAEQLAEKVADTASSRSVMKNTMIKAKRLADTVPPPQAGIKRLFQGASNQWKGEVTQEIPQIKEFHNTIDSALTAFARTMYAEKGNVANWDIARVKKSFSDIAWDTEDARSLSWNRAIDVYNDVISSYKTVPKDELIDKRELMTPKEIGRSRLLSGVAEFSDLTDDELASAYVPGDKTVPAPFKEKMLEEMKKRKEMRSQQNV